MKMKARDYAETLAGVLDEKADVKTVAENFWRILSKNGQIKELPTILALLDEVYAQRHDMSVAYVTSSEELSESTKDNIKSKIEKMSGKKVLIKTTVNPAILAGIIVKFRGEEYDLSMQNQIFKLKQHLV